jgi:hypothetical protein
MGQKQRNRHTQKQFLLLFHLVIQGEMAPNLRKIVAIIHQIEVRDKVRVQGLVVE